MKKIICTILVCASAIFCHADPYTNAVKISALPLATTPLGGTEVMVLNQGGVTKTATAAQVIAAATAANIATSNQFAALVVSISNTLAAANAAVSNTLAAANLGTTNSLAAVRAALGTLSGSNNILSSQVLGLG